MISQQPPPELIHYTSKAGLTGIINSEVMWATSTKQLNDTSEMDTVRSPLVRVLREMAVDAPSANAQGELGRYLVGSKEILAGTANQLEGKDEWWSSFVLCFSSLEDDFGMWKKFSSDYCLVFGSEVVECLRPPEKNLMNGLRMPFQPLRQKVMQVRYLKSTDEAGKDALAREIAKRIAAAGQLAGVDEESMAGLASTKDAVFASDQEWRIFYSDVTQPGHGASYVPTRIAVNGKSYIEVNVDLNCLKRVIVAPAPAPHAEAAAEFANSVLTAHGLSVPVLLSAVPVSFA